MGVWTNAITITVLQKFDVSQATISAAQTRVEVGQPVTFTGTATFTRAADASGTLYIDVYVNDTKVQTVTASYSAGATSVKFSFTLTFNQPGTYTVKAFVRIA
jgi:plastocyanin